MIWANLLHLGFNLWDDHLNTPEHPAYDEKGERRPVAWGVSDAVRFDERVWHDLTQRTHDIGMNMVVIDLGEAVVYPSHPELAVKGSWTPAKLREELSRLRKMGLEPVPKLNFSCCHDAWLKDYSRMVSTPTYYRVVRDLVSDVCEIFDHPRFVHIGMDEETPIVQAGYEFSVSRQGPLWYHDLARIATMVESHGARAWMWGDPRWGNETFARNVSKRIVQSNWYYWKDLRKIEAEIDDPGFAVKPGKPATAGENKHAELKAFLELDAEGYDQIPCATNWNNPLDMELVADFALRRIAPERLKGFLFATWESMLDDPKALAKHDEYFKLAGKIIRDHS